MAMENGLPKYIYQGSPMLDLETATWIKAMALHQGQSMSVVARALIETGRRAVELGASASLPAGWLPGTPTAQQYAEAEAEMAEFARRQRQRRIAGSAAATNRRAAEAGRVPRRRKKSQVSSVLSDA